MFFTPDPQNPFSMEQLELAARKILPHVLIMLSEAGYKDNPHILALSLTKQIIFDAASKAIAFSASQSTASASFHVSRPSQTFPDPLPTAFHKGNAAEMAKSAKSCFSPISHSVDGSGGPRDEITAAPDDKLVIDDAGTGWIEGEENLVDLEKDPLMPPFSAHSPSSKNSAYASVSPPSYRRPRGIPEPSKIVPRSSHSTIPLPCPPGALPPDKPAIALRVPHRFSKVKQYQNCVFIRHRLHHSDLEIIDFGIWPQFQHIPRIVHISTKSSSIPSRLVALGFNFFSAPFPPIISPAQSDYNFALLSHPPA
ncbi:hypothetical protein C8J56DRAFT_889606 [Mycena floridula]|nr:hypothetical protein C8J56DRAFT_889606 [Mycena floridula]